MLSCLLVLQSLDPSVPDLRTSSNVQHLQPELPSIRRLNQLAMQTSCTIDHCTECDSNNLCIACIPRFDSQRKRAQSCVTLSSCCHNAIKPTQTSILQTQSGYRSSKQRRLRLRFLCLQCILIDEISGQRLRLPGCSASLVPGYSKALTFNVVSDVELLSATLQCSYPLSSVKSSSRDCCRALTTLVLFKRREYPAAWRQIFQEQTRWPSEHSLL